MEWNPSIPSASDKTFNLIKNGIYWGTIEILIGKCSNKIVQITSKIAEMELQDGLDATGERVLELPMACVAPLLLLW